MTKPVIIAFGLFLLAMSSSAQDERIATLAGHVSEESLETNLRKIAGPGTDGRMAASKGDEFAIQYVAGWFRDHRLENPFRSQTPFLQSVPLVNVDFPNSSLKIGERQYTYDKDWACFTTSRTASVSNAEIVFIGFGLSTPSYDDLKDIDLAGKIVLLQFGEPVDKAGRPLIPDSQMPEDSIQNAIILSKKPKGMLVYGEDEVRGLVEIKAFHPYQDLRGQNRSDIPGAIITKQLAEYILGGNADSIYDIISRTGKPHSFNTHKHGTLSIVETDKHALSSNVIGMISGTDTSLPCVVVTAHHDHEGIVGDKTYFGADDNGTGTVAMLEIAKILGDAAAGGIRPRRTIAFISTAAEEQGLIGSTWYTAHPVSPLSKTLCSINVDMIGRVDSLYSGRRSDSNYVYEVYKDLPGNTINWEELKVIDDACCHLILDTLYNPKRKTPTSYGLMARADNLPFIKAGIPTIWFFGGYHHDYHQPTDTWDKVNFPLLKARTQLILATLWHLANE